MAKMREVKKYGLYWIAGKDVARCPHCGETTDLRRVENGHGQHYEGPDIKQRCRASAF
jgi:hypothetical protein